MHEWIWKTALVVLIAVILSACAAGEQPDAPATSAPATTGGGAVPGPTDAAGGPDVTVTTTVVSPTTVPVVDGPAAPDFDFVLSDGSTFSLSAEQKPVYMVFWAEW